MGDPPSLNRRIVRGLLLSAVILFMAALGAWVRYDLPGDSFAGPLPPLDDAGRALAAELAADVDFLAGEIGERHFAEPALYRAAADGIAERLAKTGLTPRREAFLATPPGGAYATTFENVLTDLQGTGPSAEVVVLGAHYDCFPANGCLGANDNASGVAALLALARRLAEGRFRNTLRFAFFANEEPPFFATEGMGSAVHAERSRAAGERVAAMVALDCLGRFDDAPRSQRYPAPLFGLVYPDRGDFIAFAGDPGARDLVARSIGVFRVAEPFPSCGAVAPPSVTGIDWSDHRPFRQIGVPAFQVTDTALFRWKEYHQGGDTADKLDYDRMARVTRGLLAVARDLAGPVGEP